MRQSEAGDYERAISREKASKFRGKARVMLKVLYFSPERMRDINRENVERLKEIFEEEGCLRKEPPERHVPVVIDIRELNRAIECSDSDTTLDTLLDNPGELPPLLKFPPNTRIECLNGKHRIQAAKECATLNPLEKWWIVDLYLKGMRRDRYPSGLLLMQF
jgi:hypothetical protein